MTNSDPFNRKMTNQRQETTAKYALNVFLSMMNSAADHGGGKQDEDQDGKDDQADMPDLCSEERFECGAECT